MIPHGFRYDAPDSLDGVLCALGEDPEGTVLLGGGSWVVPSLGRGERTARRVLDLRRAGLAGIRADGGTVRVGACVTYADLLSSAAIADRAPVLRLMATGVTGGPQILGRGTVGGAVAAARPGSDAPGALTMLDAVTHVASAHASRRVTVTDLWTGAFTTRLAPDEVLVGFEFAALPPGTGCGYVKLKHSTSSWPIVTAAAAVTLDAAGQCQRAVLAIGGACATPRPVPLAPAVVGAHINEQALCAAVAQALTDAWEDELAPAAYRTALAPVAAHRALTQALADATPPETP